MVTMGKGNYIFRDPNGNGVSTYYIEYDEDDEYEDEFFLENFRNCLSEIADKFKIDFINNRFVSSSFNNCERIFLENGVLELRVADNEWSTAIACVPKLMPNGYFNPMWEKSADKIMKEIAKIYDLHVRTSAWTSGKIENKLEYIYY